MHLFKGYAEYYELHISVIIELCEYLNLCFVLILKMIMIVMIIMIILIMMMIAIITTHLISIFFLHPYYPYMGFLDHGIFLVSTYPKHFFFSFLMV